MGDPRRTVLVALALLGALAACGDDGDARVADVDAATDAPTADGPVIDGTDAATGAPVLALDQATYTLGPDPVLVSGDTDAATMTLRNTGTGPATALTFAVTPATSELTVISSCGTSLAAGASCTVMAQLDPTSAGMKMFTVTVSSAEAAGDSALVSGLAGSRVRLTITNLAVGTTTTDGRVVSAPAGIDCGLGMTACEFIFTTAGPVTLTATDDGAGTLADWGVTECAVTGPCVLALTRNYTATTIFHAPLAVVSASAAGTSDEANGVDLDLDTSIVLAGAQGTAALLARLDGVEGLPVAAMTFGPATRRSLDVSIAPDRTVAAAGEQSGDAVMSAAPTELASEPIKQVIAGAGVDRGNGICHDDLNRVYMVGDHGDRMSWGRWPAGSATPEWLLDTTTPQGVALGATWDADTLWIAGALANQTGWLGKVDAATGALLTPTTVAGTMQIAGVAGYGTTAGGDLVVVGWTTNTLVVRRYRPALTEVWTRTFPALDGIQPDVAIEAETGAIYVAYDAAGGCTLRKLAGNGTPLWTRAGLGSHCQDVAVDSDGAVVVGWTMVNADRKYFVRKYFH